VVPSIDTVRDIEIYRSGLASYLEQVAREFDVPGISLEIVANGHRVSVVAGTISPEAGEMPGDACFKIGRSGAFLSAIVFLELVSNGFVDLSVPLARYLPDLRGSPFGERTTCEHLLTDTAGFEYSHPSERERLRKFSWANLIEMLRGARELFIPGTVYSHTFEARVLLDQVAIAVCDVPLADSLRASLRDRLGFSGEESGTMMPFHINDSKAGIIRRAPNVAMGDIWKSSLPDIRLRTRDYLRIVEAVVSAREKVEIRNLSVRTANMLQEISQDMPQLSYVWKGEALPSALCLGCQEFGSGWLGLNGPFLGQTFSFRFHSELNIAAVIGMNAGNQRACDRIFAEVVYPLDQTSRARTGGGVRPRFSVEEVVGTYSGTYGGKVSISPRGEDLSLEMPGQGRGAVKLARNIDGQWMVAGQMGQRSIALFRDVTGQSCVMIGAHAYRMIQ
jgi:hypothetical protein